MLKMLILSDWHVHGSSKKNRPIFDRLQFVRGKYSEHHIIVPGDVTDDGSANQYRQLSRLLERTSTTSSIYVARGNHDCGFAGNLFSTKAETRFDTYWGTSFKGWNKPEVHYVKNGSELLVLIMLDTVKETKWWGDFATGKVGWYQLYHLSKILDSLPKGSKRVVVMHHHLLTKSPWIQLTDAPRLRRVLYNRVDAVIFGHRHHQASMRMGGIPSVISAGAMFREGWAWELTLQGKELRHDKVKIVP